MMSPRYGEALEVLPMSRCGPFASFSSDAVIRPLLGADIDWQWARVRSVVIDRAARLAAIPVGESPANRGVQSLL